MNAGNPSDAEHTHARLARTHSSTAKPAHDLHTEIAGTRKSMNFSNMGLVEAAGVEPASENVTGQEPTYLVAFTRRELPRHIRLVRLEPTRNARR